MATYFGEVLPVSSRAVDEDDDLEEEILAEDAQKEREVILRWGSAARRSPDHKLDCRVVIVGVDQVACGFLRKHYLTAADRPVGVICCGLDAGDHNTISQRGLTDSACFAYQLKRGVSSALVVLWHHSATPFQAFCATQKLFEDLDPGSLEVFVLTSAPISEYKSSERDSVAAPLVRCLTTDSKSDEGLVFPKLEVPNIVTGLPANVLTHCQVRGIPATLFVAYVEVPAPDSINLDALLPLTRLRPMSEFTKDPASEVLEQPPPPPSKDRSHMYL